MGPGEVTGGGGEGQPRYGGHAGEVVGPGEVTGGRGRGFSLDMEATQERWWDQVR